MVNKEIKTVSQCNQALNFSWMKIIMISKLIKHSAMALALVIPVVAIADYPVGYQDQYFVRAGAVQRMEVLHNDSGESLKISGVNSWSKNGGRISIDTSERDSKPRRLQYTAPANFVGQDEFWYVLEDSQGRTNAAKVNISVLPEDANALDPQQDTAWVEKNTSVRIDVLKNDGVTVGSGPWWNGEIVSFNAWSRNGGRIKRADTDENTQQLEYTPPTGFVGVDEFWYTMKSDNNRSAVPHSAKVTINVTEHSSAGPYPIGNADNLTVYTASTVNINVRYYPLDNDVGRNLRIVERSGWSQKGGSYRVVSDGQLQYFPPSNFIGSSSENKDKIWYVIEDELGRKNWSVINFTIPKFFQTFER